MLFSGLKAVLAARPARHSGRRCPKVATCRGKHRGRSYQRVGGGSRFISVLVDLAGGLSKLAPRMTQIVQAHRIIRSRQRQAHSSARHSQQAPQVSEELLHRTETAYRSGRSLKAVARQVGIGHQRLSRLLRERGGVLRNQSPSEAEIGQMGAMYE